MRLGLEPELSQYLPRPGRMSEKPNQTSNQLQSSFGGAHSSFQAIAVRAGSSGFLESEGGGLSNKQPFEGLIANCSVILSPASLVEFAAGAVECF